MEEIYNDFSTWIRNKFPFRVQKLSIDAGFSCPNRDGKISHGGCTFCDNRTFNPSYCDRRRSVTEQIEEGKRFFSHKYPDMKYLAYFQAFSNTYAPVERLEQLYGEALSCNDVVGLVIGTRPDCVGNDVMDLLEQLSRHTFLILEFGIESTNDATLQLINRGHVFECSRRAITDAHRRRDYVEVIGVVIPEVLPMVGFDQRTPFHIYDVDEYISLVAQYLEHLRASMIVERFVSQSPAELLIAPRWGLKNHEFTAKLRNYMLRNNMQQGILYSG